MKPTMTEIYATVRVTTDGMGDGWNDESEAAESYAEWLADELTEWLESQYPDAEITVECPVLDQSGGGGVSAVVTHSDGETYTSGEFVERLHSVAQDYWERWVSDADLTADLIGDE